MPTADINGKTKNTLFPSTMTGLSEFIAGQRQYSFWLRPSNDLQSQQMVGAYLKAIRHDLKNGGYIFVKRSRAADLFRQLTELDAAYKAVNLKVMDDIAEIIDLDDPKALWIIVEDDSLPYATLASRFTVAEVAMRGHMAPPLGTPISYDEITKRSELREARGMILIMFIEMDYPSVRGFSVIQSQCRSLQIACCRVSRDNTYDHELNKLFDEPEHDSVELKGRRATTVRVFGSGQKHMAEMIGDLCSQEQAGSKTERDSFPESVINLKRLAAESRLGLAVGFENARIVDMSS